MLNYDNFAVTFGRALETFRTRPDAIPEQKTALRALVALSRLGAASLLLDEGVLTVADRPVAATLPGVAPLIAQMEVHAVREIRIAQDAAPADLLHLLRALATPLGGYADGRDITRRLRDSKVTSINVLVVPPAPPPAAGRPASVTEAFAADAVAAALAEATAAPPAKSALDAAIEDLALDPGREGVLDRLTAAAELVRGELEAGRAGLALEATAELIRLEARLPEGSARRSFAIVLKRLLTRPMLQVAANRSRLQDGAEAAKAVLRRGGADSTEVLLERLVQAGSMSERRHYFDLIRAIGEGLRQVILMLAHHEWFAVRNVANLLGELRVAEAVGPLARTLRHADPRVRRAAALALARIGTPETVEHLAALLEDPDPELRIGIASAIGGREMEALAMPLVLAARREGEPRVLHEYYRALGRIGSAAAVQALARAAQPVRWRWWRRRPGARLGAVEGLKLVGGAAALGLLEGLLDDRDPEIRRAAREALEDLDLL